MRPPLGPEPMVRTVRFRLSAADEAMLRDIAGQDSMSVTIRRLIVDEWSKRRDPSA